MDYVFWDGIDEMMLNGDFLHIYRELLKLSYMYLKYFQKGSLY